MNPTTAEFAQYARLAASLPAVAFREANADAHCGGGRGGWNLPPTLKNGPPIV